jgi:hypothetical protein
MFAGHPWLMCVPYRPPGVPFSLSGADAAVLQLIQPATYACVSYRDVALVAVGVCALFCWRYFGRR